MIFDLKKIFLFPVFKDHYSRFGMKYLWMFAEYLHSPTIFNMLKRLCQNNSHELCFLAIEMNCKVNDENVYGLRVEQ